MPRHPIPADIRPENLVALIDTREQCPLDLAPLAVDIATLATGDYSIRGLEHVVAIERKSLSDLLGCVGRERDRFEKEIQRLLAYPCRCLVIEATWKDIENGTEPNDGAADKVCQQLLGLLSKGSALQESDMARVLDNAERALNPPKWRGEITPAQALGSLLGWIVAGVPVLMAGDHERAGRYVARMLLLAARRRWRESRGLLAVLDENPISAEPTPTV